MIYDQKNGALYGDDGEFLKTLHCPLALHFAQLTEIDGSSDRHCPFCSSDVLNIDEVSEDELKDALAEEPELCVFSTPAARNLTILRPDGFAAENEDDLIVVRTARGMTGMENAFASGYRLVLKQVREPNDEGGPEKYMLWQNPETSEVVAIGDYRAGEPGEGFVHVAGWFWYDTNLPFPFAAYLVPRDLPVGSRVFLEDLIDVVWIETWNQGNAVRQLSSPATWNGSDFDLEEIEAPYPSVMG